MTDRNIPSEEDFARADAWDDERWRGIGEACSNVLARFQKSGKLHELFIFPRSERHPFAACVFYRWERQINEAESSGLADEIRSAVFEELEKVRGDEGAINVDFEFDSHENVERNYGGNYDKRLR